MYPELALHQHYTSKSQNDYLNRLDELPLRKRIHRYARMKRIGWSANRFRSEVNRVLTPPGFDSYVFPQNSIPLVRDSRLFRARVIESPDQIQEVANVMHSPHSASAGRLNKEGESLLYTASDISTALLEVRSDPGDLVSITQFSAKADLTTVALGRLAIPPNLPMSQRKKLGLIGDFLATLISQSDKPYGEADYAETEFVTKELYDLPAEFFSGWSYPSFVSQKSRGMNFAFRPTQAEESLKLDTVIIADVMKIGGSGTDIYVSNKLVPTDTGMLIPDPKFDSTTFRK